MVVFWRCIVYSRGGVPLKWGKYIRLIIIALFLCFKEGTFTVGERVVSFENGNKCSVVANYMYKEKYAHICMSFFLASAMYNILSGQGENV